MPNIKGVDIFVLRSVIFKEQEKGVETQFLSRLTPPQTELYLNIVANAWVPVNEIEPLYKEAAKAFFPFEADSICRFSRMIAHKSFTSIYKVFFHHINCENAIKRANTIWSIYHVKGRQIIQSLNGHGATVVVTEYTELPAVLREVYSGQLMALMELAGAENVRVLHNGADPNAWSWQLAWRQPI